MAPSENLTKMFCHLHSTMKILVKPITLQWLSLRNDWFLMAYQLKLFSAERFGNHVHFEHSNNLKIYITVQWNKKNFLQKKKKKKKSNSVIKENKFDVFSTLLVCLVFTQHLQSTLLNFTILTHHLSRLYQWGNVCSVIYKKISILSFKQNRICKFKSINPTIVFALFKLCVLILFFNQLLNFNLFIANLRWNYPLFILSRVCGV